MVKALINGITVNYRDQGHGTPLVFIHAFPLSQSMWQPQVEALRESYRIITLDLRGHGESDTILWNFTLDDYAADVIGLLDHLGIDKAVFIGLSMGGYTVWSLCRHFKDRIHALVLADTRAQADSPEGKAGRLTMAQTAFQNGTAAIADLMIPKLLASSTIQHRPEIVKKIRRIILGNTPAGVVVDLMAMASRPDSTDLLPLITCPTLVLVGEEDVATPVGESRYIADRIPGATLVTIPGAGHLSNYERPEVFNRALCSFLNEWSL